MPPTTDPAERLGAIADALVDAFSGIDGMTVLPYDPGVGPVAHMQMGVGDVTFRTTQIDQRGHVIGKRDWWEEWTVRFYVHMEGADSWDTARQVIGQANTGLEMDPTLGGEVREAAITAGRVSPSDPLEQGRRMLIGELTVSVLQLNTDPRT